LEFDPPLGVELEIEPGFGAYCLVTTKLVVWRSGGRLSRSGLLSPDGFSLVELLIVIALIFVLFTLYFSGGSRRFQTRAKTQCEQNLQTVYVALKTFSLGNNGQLPILSTATTSEAPLSQLVPRYTTGTEFFTCPGCNDRKLPDAQPFADRKISYAFYMGHAISDGSAAPLMSDRQVNSEPKLAGQPLFSSDGQKPGNNHNRYGGNILFCDGSVQSSTPASAFNLTNAPGVVLLNPKP
jgi:prepilin-type N-terminal cleavage/methylation domain-containing protein/prepilin-type processing-associated H-X9-DG protein